MEPLIDPDAQTEITTPSEMAQDINVPEDYLEKLEKEIPPVETDSPSKAETPDQIDLPDVIRMKDIVAY